MITGYIYDYICRDWYVFPCEPNGKRPLGALAPHGVKDATIDMQVLRDWWLAEPTANVALRTGRISDLIVVDVDKRHDGHETLRTLALAHDLPRTRVVRTPSGGWHIYYTTPPERIPNSAGRLGVGIDVRGDNGYVLAPPASIDGNHYTVIRDEPLAQLPQWMVEILKPKRSAAGPPAPAPIGVGTAYGITARDRIYAHLGKTGEGARNDELNAAAYSLGRLIAAGHLRESDVRADLEHIAGTLGLEQGETLATIASGIGSGMERPSAVSAHDSPRRLPPSARLPRLFAPRA